jgi:hypothetical protein
MQRVLAEARRGDQLELRCLKAAHRAAHTNFAASPCMGRS